MRKSRFLRRRSKKHRWLLRRRLVEPAPDCDRLDTMKLIGQMLDEIAMKLFTDAKILSYVERARFDLFFFGSRCKQFFLLAWMSS
ncbi:hypothetical protein Csa_010610 [Cucumis sativus]|uniref:Uncharacterized protein n=1 Tax=Cucumis sativus TaxID=3659 RepID=A0A0A0L8R6_CUCSA|nr:hypothetical protein Csa_010610 [Cucumis sativus]